MKNSLLLVEDNADDELLMMHAFAAHRIKNPVVVVRDGAEALDYLFCRGKFSSRKLNDLPEIVLLDLKLPKVGGLEVLQQIRESKHAHLLPVIILTSSKEERDLLEGYKNGANSYIVKPLDATQFSDCIKQLGLYWLVLNEPVPREKI